MERIFETFEFECWNRGSFINYMTTERKNSNVDNRNGMDIVFFFVVLHSNSIQKTKIFLFFFVCLLFFNPISFLILGRIKKKRCVQ